jgi:hypothetical protein
MLSTWDDFLVTVVTVLVDEISLIDRRGPWHHHLSVVP